MKLLTLTKGKLAKVSDIDHPHLNQWKWSLHRKGYAHRRGPGPCGPQTCYLLHRVVAQRAGRNMARQIDHIDQDKLNCQRYNLRPATNSQNLANRGKQRNNTSGYKGVTWDKARSKWLAQIQVDGHQLFLGRFTNRRKAYTAYKAAAFHYFGSYACVC